MTSFGGFGGGFGATGAGFGAAAPASSAPAFGAPAATTFGFGAAAKPTLGFGSTGGAAGFGAATTSGFGAFGATGSSAAAAGGAAGFGAATTSGFGAFGATGSSAAAAGGGFSFGAATAKPTSFGAGTGAAGFGASAGAAFGASTGAGLGGFKASTGTGFGAAASTGAGFGAAGGFGATFGAAGAFGAGASAAAAAPGAFGAVGAFGVGASAAAATTVAARPASGADAINNLVCPIEGVPRLLQETDDKGQAILSKESGEVFEAFNQHISAWSPWHPGLLTHYGRLAQAGAFRAVEQKCLQFQSLDPSALDKELRGLPQDLLQLVKVAMMPRFDATTLQGSLANNRTPPDVVENQWNTSDWKPLLDNPNSRFRHYVLQPLTQAQMKLPAEQRHGLNQTKSSSPNDPLFQSKLQENPNPYKYCVLPIVGFHQLLRRVKMQDEKLAEQHSVLQRLEGELNRMREFQTVHLPKMLAHRRATQVELGRRALEVMRCLEERVQQAGTPSSRDLQVLGDRIDQASQQISTTLQRRLQRLEEVMGELRMQDRKRLKQRPVAAPTCDPEALTRLNAFLEHRLTGIGHLRDIVAKDVSDVSLIQTRL